MKHLKEINPLQICCANEKVSKAYKNIYPAQTMPNLIKLFAAYLGFYLSQVNRVRHLNKRLNFV